jgi:hypothetical protein
MTRDMLSQHFGFTRQQDQYGFTRHYKYNLALPARQLGFTRQTTWLYPPDNLALPASDSNITSPPRYFGQ